MKDKKETPKGTDLKKKAMIEAMEKSLGIVTSATKIAGIDRATHYRWMQEDEEYKESIESVNNIALDFAESQLHQKIKEKDTTAIIFYLKTKGKSRGYIEKSELSLDTTPVNLIVTDKL
jgi:hypothetical protein